MGYLADNIWLRYVDKTYQQIKDRVLTQMASYVPEITDHTESDPYVKTVGIWAGIAEMLGYYIDNSARESFLSTCRLYKSGIYHAKRADYRVHARTAYSADIIFTSDILAPSDILIPVGTVVTFNGIPYQTIANATIPTGETTIAVSAEQRTDIVETTIGNTNGTLNQEIVIDETVKDQSVTIKVNSVVYDQKDTLAYSLPTDLHYVQSVNKDGKVIIRFGDGTNGILPATGLSVKAVYSTTLGLDGAAGRNTLTTIQTLITLPVGVTLTATNPLDASGGGDVENLLQLKQRIPISKRTNYRAVTRQDYADMTLLQGQVSDADATYVCGRNAQIFIVPVGGGLPSTMLLDSIKTFMDDKIIWGTNLDVVAAGQIEVLLSIDLKVKDRYIRTNAVANVIDTITTYMSYLHQKIGGTFRIGDLYQQIEETEGVDSSAITSLIPIPVALPNIDTTQTLNWTRILLEGSLVKNSWQIVFTTDTVYQVLKNGFVVGEYNVGSTATFDEVEFNIFPPLTGTYGGGDTFSFTTYPINATIIQLNEPSILVSVAGDITINASGGI